MSCNYNNCTQVTGNFYAGATFITLSDPTAFYGNQPIYFYDAANCPAPNCCNPDVSGTVLGTPTATGVSLTAGLAAPVQASWKACYTLSNGGTQQSSATTIPCSSPSAVTVTHPNQNATVEYELACDSGQAIILDQVLNGVASRMSILYLLLGAKDGDMK